VENFRARAINAQVKEHCQRGKQSRCRFSVSANDSRGR
jgi:hypothetical protein